MTQYGTWVGYGGDGRIALAAAFGVATAGALYAGVRGHFPARAARPGKAVAVVLLSTWILSIAMFFVGLGVYIEAAQRANLLKAPPTNPITVVTFTSVLAIFGVVVLKGWQQGLGVRARLSSATIAAMAAPMIFELPFDLAVMARTFPALPPNPALYRAVFFLPLFLIEITTLGLLTFSPLVRVKKQTLFALAAMFFVFVIWALTGYNYPSTPISIILNATSKLLAFLVALTLFLPPRNEAGLSARPKQQPELAARGQGVMS
jgi:hypothetical protein